MHADERQRRIVEQARRGGRVEVSRLALELDVTQETIRRDLTNLERLGEVKRVHGGAVPLDRLGLGLEPRLEDRESRMAAEKDRIAKLALDELPESGSIIVDAGTTTARFVAHLPADRELTVVINGLDIAATLSRMPKLKVLLVGGQVRARTLAVVDTWGNGLLNDLYVDVAFIGTDGISAQRGLTTPDAAEATAKRAMISAARRTVLLADHTKVGKEHLVRFADVADIDTFVCDSGLDPKLSFDLQARGTRVATA